MFPRLVFILVPLFYSCQQETSQKSERTQAKQQDAKTTQDSPEPKSTKDEDSTTIPKVSGEEFFADKVITAFNLCQRCHAPDNIPVERDRGPVTIYEYASMLRLLDQNTLLPMIRGTQTNRPHPVNDPCLSGLNSSPCKEIVQWWDIEYSEIASKAKDRPLVNIGKILDISTDGIVTGWALNPRDLTQTVSVVISINQSSNFPIEANLDTFDDDSPGAHGFRFEIPEQFKDGIRHQLQARINLGEPIELDGSPYNFASVPKTAAGKQFFDQNVNTLLLANCGCHGTSLDYDYSWDRLASPLPTEGGNATNNRLYGKGSGQTAHAGGNACSNNETCTAISQWWQEEFGNL